MNPISELQDLCNFAVSISINNLMINWIEFLKTQNPAKSIVDVYNIMIEKLNQIYVSEFQDPYSIGENVWGCGSGEQFRPIPDIHDIYYQNIRSQINQYFVDKIYCLNTGQGFQTKAKNIENNLATFFTIPRNILYDRASKNSSFHNFYGKYSTWWNERYKTQEVMNINFENLKKLVDEYS